MLLSLVVFFSPDFVDFNSNRFPTLLVLGAGNNTGMCSLVSNGVLDDRVALEPTVSFTLRIAELQPFDAGVVISPETMEIFVVDDDGESR